jgi:hypothetical protein
LNWQIHHSNKGNKEAPKMRTKKLKLVQLPEQTCTPPVIINFFTKQTRDQVDLIREPLKLKNSSTTARKKRQE